MARNRRTYTRKEKLRIVKMHIAQKRSLRDTAKRVGISYKTLWNWLQQYRIQGETAFSARPEHRRALPKAIEKQIMLLKEANPALSIARAQQLLKQQQTDVSQRQIWNVWKAYGLSKKRMADPLDLFGTATAKSTDSIKRAHALVRTKDFPTAARILNALTSMPRDPVLRKIPEKYLSPRRRLERLSLEFGEIPFPELRKKAHNLGIVLEKNGLIYSSIIANFMELMILGWIKRPEKRISLCQRLERKMRRAKSRALWFLFHCEQAMAYAELLKMEKAISHMRECRKLVYLLPYRFYQASFGDIMTALGRYKNAHAIFMKILEHEHNPEVIGPLALKAAFTGPAMAGDYKRCKKMLTKAAQAKDLIGFSSGYILNRAYIAYGHGRLADAATFFVQSLEKTFRGELYNRLYAAASGMAAVAMALNKKQEAQTYLRKYLPLMKKHRLLREIIILTQLAGTDKPIPAQAQEIRILQLLSLLVQANQTAKLGDYRKAYNYASKQKLLGLLHRWIVFFPDVVVNLLEHGRKTGLPASVLTFPLFNQNTPVYHIKFLGDIVVIKNHYVLRVQLRPKEQAFLIHLALRCGTPGASVSVHSLHQNFWKQSTKPSQRLAHLMVDLKKKLSIPGHLLSISSASGERRLINRGIHMTTDLTELETLLAQAQTLERADEWRFAERDYIRAFTLLRGAPFKKMYDTWSDDMRSTILNKIESALTHFAQESSERKLKEETKRVLKNATAIISFSEHPHDLSK